MKQVFHLDGADRSRHLQPGIYGFPKRFPGDLNGFLVCKADRNRDRSVFHSGTNGLDKKPVNFLPADRTKINRRDTKLVNQSAQFDFFFKTQFKMVFSFRKCTITHIYKFRSDHAGNPP